MLTVWGRRSSSNVQCVLWCLAELGIAHRRVDAGFTYGVVDTPEYRAMNPNGTVPTIRDDDAPRHPCFVARRRQARSGGADCAG